MNHNWVVTLTYALEPDTTTMDRWEDQLAALDASIARVPGRGIDLTIHADDTTLDQAVATARAGAAEVIDVDPVGVEIITEDEHLRRAEAFTAPELMSAAEIADALNVSRQRVHQLRTAEHFPQPLADLRGGAVWDARAIRQFAAEWTRRPGRPPAGWAVSYECFLDGAWQRLTEQRSSESEALEFYKLLLANSNVRDARLISSGSD